MVAHIVQTGHLLLPVAATAAKASPASRILPILILIGLLFVFTRYRSGRRRGVDPRGPQPMRRPRSAREAMRQPAEPRDAERDSDTDPQSRSEHTRAE